MRKASVASLTSFFTCASIHPPGLPPPPSHSQRSWYRRSAGADTNTLTDRLGDLFPELVRLKLTDVVLASVIGNAGAPTLIPRLRVLDLTFKDQADRWSALTTDEEASRIASARSFFARLSCAAPCLQELYIAWDGRTAAAATMHAVLQVRLQKNASG